MSELRTKDMSNQIRRIRQMERRLVRVAASVKRLSTALDQFEAVQDDLTALNQYYGSDEWRQDFAADEAGLLPDGLKRGVLSEDAVWNLLSDCRELKQRYHDDTSRK